MLENASIQLSWNDKYLPKAPKKYFLIVSRWVFRKCEVSLKEMNSKNVKDASDVPAFFKGLLSE